MAPDTSKPFLRKRAVRWSVIATGLLLAGMLGVAWLWKPATAFPPIPQPNGYEALTRAASMLQRPQDVATLLGTDQLSTTSSANQAALAELRRCLQLPGAVPVQISQAWLASHTRNLVKLKAASEALDAEAELAQRRGHTNHALLHALDGLRLAEATQRGGLLIDFAVGSACEIIAICRMTNLLRGMDPTRCKEAIQFLHGYDERRDSLEKIRMREAEWSHRTFGVFQRIGMMIRSRSLRLGNGFAGAIADAAKRHASATRKARLLLLQLGAHAYTLEHGKPPKKASDLVPAYLQRLPVDPATGKPLELQIN